MLSSDVVGEHVQEADEKLLKPLLNVFKIRDKDTDGIVD